MGQEFCTAYAASEFGVEGWIESLTPSSRRSASARVLVEQKAKDLLAQADAYRELSSNLAHDAA